ncbi:MAG: hypothetical protein MMC23_001990 [Stictis urceolatum]|nr:hypothetical protein [Stictis urceolata]
MLLILSDMLKAICYFVFPIVLYARGDSERRNTPFCYASGFFLALAIEGADYAVLIIAIHAALGIFSSKTSLGESGLYDFRYAVYVGWLLIPGLMASLAFLNNQEAYITQGTFCYLPVRPYWYRLALSWIPRYLILLSIAGTALAIYVYVGRKFKDFDDSSNGSYGGLSNVGQSRNRGKRSSQQAPTDGTQLTGSSIPTVVGSTPALSRRTAVEQSDPDAMTPSSPGPAWENYQFGGPTPIPKPLEHELNNEDLHFKLKAARHRSADSGGSRRSGDDTDAIIEALREVEPPAIEMGGALDGNISSHNLHLVDSNNLPIATARLRARHKAIQRQLRFVFVYPLVYLAMWIIPFVQHCLNYSDNYSLHPNFPLSCLTTVVLALQCTVDCIVFSIREKPWRFLGVDGEDSAQTFMAFLTPSSRRHTRAKSTASEGLANRPEYSASSRPLSGLSFYSPTFKSSGVSKSKADRIAEARQARQRRDAETAAARESRRAKPRERKKSEARWWEVEGKRRKDSVLLGTDAGDNSLAPTETTSSLRTADESEAGPSTSHDLPRTRTKLSSQDAYDGNAVGEGPLAEASRGMSVVPEGEEEPYEGTTKGALKDFIDAAPASNRLSPLSIAASHNDKKPQKVLSNEPQDFIEAGDGDASTKKS